MNAMMEAVRRQRKFTIAMLSLGLSFVGLMTGHIESEDFKWIVGMVVGLYGWSNVQDKKAQA